MSKKNPAVNPGRFTTKFRIVAAIEQENILLLTRLLGKLNHPPDAPVDKLGSNIFHMACYMGKLSMVQYIYDTFHLPVNEYNTDGIAPIHLAVRSCNLKVVKWLYDHGADCHAPTQVFMVTPYQKCCSMLANRKYFSMKKKLEKIKSFLIAKYYDDQRGYEIRKFLWCAKMLKGTDRDIGKLPCGMIREIAEYI